MQMNTKVRHSMIKIAQEVTPDHPGLEALVKKRQRCPMLGQLILPHCFEVNVRPSYYIYWDRQSYKQFFTTPKPCSHCHICRSSI
ncbi:hypothetical protein MPSEU_000777100 [Mayamaea pseudoterrestris]|nr:hypothetical protein MPSEU_000777100 [Mayamaea pseudoterrestris]